MTAQNYFNESIRDTPNIARIVPRGACTRIGVDTVQTVTLPAGASGIMFSAEGQTVRWTIDGSTPTATLGLRQLTTVEPMRLILPGSSTIRFIGEAAGGFINYQCFSSLV